MTTPDLSGYVDLTIYDLSPQDIFQAALDDLQLRLPDYVAYEGNLDVLLLEELALEVAEASYALNRVPGALAEALFQLYGVYRYYGDAPRATVQFSMADALGHVVPAGTTLQLSIGDAFDPVTFITDGPIATAPGETLTQPIGVTATTATSDANGRAIGTVLTLVDALFFVDGVTLASPIIGGVDPEDTTTWLNRASAVLARLNMTLVLPTHFTSFALENPKVARATTIDNWQGGYNPPTQLAATPSGTGGTLTHGATYGFAVTATTAAGETLPCARVTAVIPGGADTGSVALTWSAPVSDGGPALTGYKIYRTTPNGTTLGLVSTVAAGTTSYTSTGSTTPGAAPPALNGTGRAAAGYVTTAVYGPDDYVTDVDKATLQASMNDAAQANLGVAVVDATITAVNVTATVVPAAGYAAATATADAATAVREYLATASWPWLATVRRNALIAALGSPASVAYVDALAAPAADVTLPGVGPLAAPGVVNVSAAT